MKKLLIAIVIIIIIIIGILGFALLNANKLIAQFKPELEHTVSGLIGAEIELHDISATVLPQTALKVSGLTIKSSSGKTDAEPGPAFNQFLLKLNLKALLAGKLDITQVLIIEPKLTIIKSSSGIRLQGLPLNQIDSKLKSSDTASASVQEKNEKSKQSAANRLSKIPIAINLEAFELKNGSVLLEDQTANKIYSLTQLNIDSSLKISGDTITTSDLNIVGKLLEKFPFKISVPNVSLTNQDLSIGSFSALIADLALQGTAAFNLNSHSGNAAFSSPGINLNQALPVISSFLPIINQFGLKGSIIPNVKVKFQEPAAFSAEGTVALSNIEATQGIFAVKDLGGTLSLKASDLANAEINSEDLKLNLNNQAINLKFLAKLAGKNLSLENLVLNLLGGSINGNVNLSLDESKAFTTKLQGGSIDIERALALIQSKTAQVSGSIDSLTTAISGHLGSDLKESLRGNVNVKLSNGELKGWNLAGMVLKAVNNLPFLTAPLYSSVPDTARSALDSNNTAFKSLDSSISFNGAGMDVESLKMFAPIFSIEANGKIGFDSDLDLSSNILFNSSFSSTLVSRVKELKNVLDDQGQLVFPLKLQGKPPLVVVYPNVKKLLEVAGKRIIVNNAEDAVRGLLQKKGLGGVGGLLGF